ncbi:branched-chain amino acid ABC transporter permease [Aeromicrobium sp. PE09-221]|uniref:branched-chain amino acid ABC transporter permease n=1 Tax=Aeromicrobium sp. PE09-221 TaxID=1898043 RepID=UPI000B3E56B4|nr:branched-chain amino acid ABC transporter permease [Aeromicrobium sp. PE09-221]
MTRESTLPKPASLPAKRSLMRPAVIGIVAVALLVAGGQLPDFRVSQIASMLIFAIAISGLNLVAGYGGMLSLGHSALFGVGGYTTAILISEMRLTPLSTMPIAIALGVLVGALMGLPATRVKGIYLALVTLAFAVAFPEFLKRFEELTGGAGGLVVRSVDLAPPAWSGFDRFERSQWMYWLSAVVLVLCLFLVRNLIRSRRGLSITALRDNEIAATVCGVSAARDRISLFAISGGITAAGGSLYAMYIGALSPELSFTVFTSIQLITGLIIGGVATLLGPLAGGVAIVIIPAVTLDLANGQAYGLVFGVVLIVVVFLLPDGIVGRLQKMRVFTGRSQSAAHTST